MDLPTDHSPNSTNELAKERNRAAAERTILSWVQNSVGLIGFGIAFERIFNAINETFPDNEIQINIFVSEAIGFAAIGFGLFLLATAVITYRKEILALERENYLYQSDRFSDLFLVLAGSVILFGFISLIVIFLVKY